MRILEVLADGEWRTLDELVRAAGPLVPPGRAARWAEADRVRSNAKTSAALRPRVRPADEIAVGRRDIVRRSMRGLVRAGKVQRGATGRYRRTGA